jgi:hypothetical protein
LAGRLNLSLQASAGGESKKAANLSFSADSYNNASQPIVFFQSIIQGFMPVILMSCTFTAMLQSVLLLLQKQEAAAEGPKMV